MHELGGLLAFTPDEGTLMPALDGCAWVLQTWGLGLVPVTVNPT